MEEPNELNFLVASQSLLNISQGQILILGRLEQTYAQLTALTKGYKELDENLKRLDKRFQVIWDRVSKGKGNYYRDVEKIIQATTLGIDVPNPTLNRLTTDEIAHAFDIRDQCDLRAPRIYDALRARFPKDPTMPHVEIPNLVCVKIAGWAFWPAEVIIVFRDLPLNIIHHFRQQLASLAQGKLTMIRWFREIFPEEEEAKQAENPNNYLFIKSVKNPAILDAYELRRERLPQKRTMRRQGFDLASAIACADMALQKQLEQKRQSAGRKALRSTKASCMTATQTTVQGDQNFG